MLKELLKPEEAIQKLKQIKKDKVKEYSKKYYQDNKERLNKMSRDYIAETQYYKKHYKDDKEIIKANIQKRKEAKKDGRGRPTINKGIETEDEEIKKAKKKEYAKKYYQENKERLRQMSQVLVENEYFKKYYEENKEKLKADAKRRYNNKASSKVSPLKNNKKETEGQISL